MTFPEVGLEYPGGHWVINDQQ